MPLFFRRCRTLTLAIAALGLWSAAASPSFAQTSCPQSDSGLTLPPGFCATIFADGIEQDHLNFDWGRTMQVHVSSRHLNLVMDATDGHDRHK